MRIPQHTIQETGEFEGILEFTLQLEDNIEYDFSFPFEKHSTGPNSNTPFPSPDKDIYAWPEDQIPDTVLDEFGDNPEEQMNYFIVSLDLAFPDDIHILEKSYEKKSSE